MWPLLESLPASDQAKVLAAARGRNFDRGEVVFREGDPGDSLHLVESGIFAVQVSGPSGDSVTVNVLAPGDFFGELALIGGVPTHRRTATVVSLVPSNTLVLAGSAFTVLRKSNPMIDQLVVTALVQRVEQLSARLLEALHVGADRRVYGRLLELAEACSRTSTGLVIPVTQDDLASMAGASRPTVNQILQKLVSRGIISLQRRQITIEDLAALRAASPGYDG